jgi:hypothetical protein
MNRYLTHEGNLRLEITGKQELALAAQEPSGRFVDSRQFGRWAEQSGIAVAMPSSIACEPYTISAAAPP